MYKLIFIKILIVISLSSSCDLMATKLGINDSYSNDKPKLIEILDHHDFLFKDSCNNFIVFRAHQFMNLYPDGEIKLLNYPQYSLVGWNSLERIPENLQTIKLPSHLTSLFFKRDYFIKVLENGSLRIQKDTDKEDNSPSLNKVHRQKKWEWFLPLSKEFSSIKGHFMMKNVVTLQFAAPAIEP